MQFQGQIPKEIPGKAAEGLEGTEGMYSATGGSLSLASTSTDKGAYPRAEQQRREAIAKMSKVSLQDIDEHEDNEQDETEMSKCVLASTSNRVNTFGYNDDDEDSDEDICDVY